MKVRIPNKKQKQKQRYDDIIKFDLINFQGAYYFFMTEPNKNYEETILDIIRNFTGEIIPFK